MTPVSPASWRRAGLLTLLMLVATLWLQREPLLGMVGIWWRSDTFAHALLVPPIALWLAWRKRDVLAGLVPVVWPPGLVLVALGALLGAAGELAQVNAAQHFAIVFLIQGTVLLCLGKAVGRVLAFPLLFLLFAPPFGEFLLPVMMSATADFTVAALKLTGIPVYREGLVFIIPSGTWSVVEACSGVRYLMASAMVGSLFAYLNFNGWRKRAAFVAFSLLVPLVANWLRAYFIVLLGHVSDNRLATGADHLVYGWVFFGFIMLIMFMVGARFADPFEPAPEASAVSSAAQPVSASAWAALVGALLTAAALALWSQSLRGRLALPVADAVSAQLRQPLAGSSEGAGLPQWAPVFVGADGQAQHVMPGDVQFDIAYFAQQREGAKAISSENVLVRNKDASWQVLERGTTSVAGVAQETYLIKGRSPDVSGDWVARRVYWVDGRFTASAAKAKLWGLWQLARSQGDAAAVVVWITRKDDAAQARLDQSWQGIQGALNDRLKALATQHAGHNSNP